MRAEAAGRAIRGIISATDPKQPVDLNDGPSEFINMEQ